MYIGCKKLAFKCIIASGWFVSKGEPASGSSPQKANLYRRFVSKGEGLLKRRVKPRSSYQKENQH
jgi:hypothetical protein